MHTFDILFLILIAIVQPIYGWRSHRHMLDEIRRGVFPDRIVVYRANIAMEWAAFAVLAAAWWWLGRPWSDLGARPLDTTAWLVGGSVTALLVVVLLGAWRHVLARTGEERTAMREGTGDLVHLLPHDDRELRHGIVLSITAGIVEEVIYRGFLIWAFALHMPLWAAVIASSAVFGVAHGYQGAAGVAKVFVAGLLFAALYVVTGSIWFPILAHALADILQLAAARELWREGELATAD